MTGLVFCSTISKFIKNCTLPWIQSGLYNLNGFRKLQHIVQNANVSHAKSNKLKTSILTSHLARDLLNFHKQKKSINQVDLVSNYSTLHNREKSMVLDLLKIDKEWNWGPLPWNMFSLCGKVEYKPLILKIFNVLKQIYNMFFFWGL